MQRSEDRVWMLVVDLLAARNAGDYERAILIGDQAWEEFSGVDEVTVERQVAIATIYRERFCCAPIDRNRTRPPSMH